MQELLEVIGTRKSKNDKRNKEKHTEENITNLLVYNLIKDISYLKVLLK